MRLKEIRKKLDLSQKDIANILNISQVQVSRIEKGKSLLNSKQIIKLCTVLNVTADELLGLKPIEERALDIKKRYQSNLSIEQIQEAKETLEKIAKIFYED